MAGYSHLYRRGAAYWFRRRVPSDLRGPLKRLEWKEALGTKDLAEAKARLHRRMIQTNAEIAAARRAQARSPSQPLTSAEAEALARAEEAEWNRLDAELRLLRGSAWYENVETSLEADEGDYREALARADWKFVADQAEEVLEKAGRWYPRGDLSFRLMCLALLAAHVRHMEELRRRQRGEPYSLPDTAPQLSPSPPAGVRPELSLGSKPRMPFAQNAEGPGAMTLAELIRRFRERRVREHGEESTERKYAHIFRALEEAIGPQRPIQSIEREDCYAVKDLLARVPAHMGKRYRGLSLREAIEAAERDGAPKLSPNTLATYLNNLSAVFNWAVEQRWLSWNPAKGLGEKGQASVRRRGFTRPELERVFSALAKQRGDHPHRFWMPALALFTGARAGELAQLLQGDVKQEDGVWILDISEFDSSGVRVADKRLKTRASERKVPLHPQLIRAGFLDFAGKRGGPSERLFPQLERGPHGNYTHEFSKWWGRFLDEIGLKERALTFHGFRHGFRDALRRAHVSIEVIDALGGWRTPGVGTRYGDEHRRPTATAPELAKIDYWGFSLPVHEAEQPRGREAA